MVALLLALVGVLAYDYGKGNKSAQEPEPIEKPVVDTGSTCLPHRTIQPLDVTNLGHIVNNGFDQLIICLIPSFDTT